MSNYYSKVTYAKLKSVRMNEASLHAAKHAGCNFDVELKNLMPFGLLVADIIFRKYGSEKASQICISMGKFILDRTPIKDEYYKVIEEAFCEVGNRHGIMLPKGMLKKTCESLP